MEPINDPKTDCEDLDYWEIVLASHGLSMNRGNPSRRIVSNSGTINNLVRVEQAETLKNTGKVTPKGKGPTK